MIFFADFSQNFSERALLLLKNSIMISSTKIGIVEHGLPISVTISITIFCTVEHPFYSRRYLPKSALLRMVFFQREYVDNGQQRSPEQV